METNVFYCKYIFSFIRYIMSEDMLLLNDDDNNTSNNNGTGI